MENVQEAEVASAVMRAKRGGAGKDEIREVVEKCLRVFASRWRVTFEDAYTGEGGDMGVEFTGRDEAVAFVWNSWKDVQRDLDRGSQPLVWTSMDPPSNVAYGQYWVVGQWFRCTYTIREM